MAISLEPEEKARIIARLQVPMDIAWLANSANVQGILDKVRNIILEWSLKLETLGIKGDGLSFSPGDNAERAGGVVDLIPIELRLA